MAYCVICGNKNDDEARFCVSCGAELSAVVTPDEPKNDLETVEKKTIETVEESGDIIVTETEVKVEAPKKRGRKKKVKEEPPVEEAAEAAAPEPKEDEQETPFTFEPSTEGKAAKEEETEAFFASFIDEVSEGACEPDIENKQEAERMPEGIDGYIPPVSTNGSDVYRPQYVSSPYSEPTRIGEPININTSVPPVAPQTAYAPPQTYPAAMVAQDAVEEKVKPISTAGFFWLDILYIIPGVGLIMSIILSFAAGNKNIKSHARAALIVRLVIYVLLLIAAVVLIILDARYGIFYDMRRGWLNHWYGIYY